MAIVAAAAEPWAETGQPAPVQPQAGLTPETLQPFLRGQLFLPFGLELAGNHAGTSNKS
jgi:hypothetical protein